MKGLNDIAIVSIGTLDAPRGDGWVGFMPWSWKAFGRFLMAEIR